MLSRCALALSLALLLNVFNCPTCAVAPTCVAGLANPASCVTQRLELGLRLKGGEGTEQTSAPATRIPPNPLKIFVGNLPRIATEDQLKEHFAQAGEITSVKIQTTQRGMPKGFGFIEFATEDAAKRAITLNGGGQFLNRVLIVRADVGFDPEFVAQRRTKREAARAAKEAFLKKIMPEDKAEEKLKQQQLRERRQQIGGPDYWPAAPRACRVYVGNIRFGTRWQEVRDHLSQAGQVVFGRIIKQPVQAEDGSVQYRSKGFAIVQFATPEEAGNAMKTLNDTDFNGRRLFVRPDTSTLGTNGRRTRQPNAASGAPAGGEQPQAVPATA